MDSGTIDGYRALGENARSGDRRDYSYQDYSLHKLLSIIGYLISLADSSHSADKAVKVNLKAPYASCLPRHKFANRLDNSARLKLVRPQQPESY